MEDRTYQIDAMKRRRGTTSPCSKNSKKGRNAHYEVKAESRTTLSKLSHSVSNNTSTHSSNHRYSHQPLHCTPSTPLDSSSRSPRTAIPQFPGKHPVILVRTVQVPCRMSPTAPQCTAPTNILSPNSISTSTILIPIPAESSVPASLCQPTPRNDQSSRAYLGGA